MKFWISLKVAEFILSLPFMQRPQFLADPVPETPSMDALNPGVLFCEVRGGYLKWAHLRCPKCNDHIQLPLVGKGSWSLSVDLLRRPTLAPSIWETQSCGAHFFIRKGYVLWCEKNIDGYV